VLYQLSQADRQIPLSTFLILGLFMDVLKTLYNADYAAEIAGTIGFTICPKLANTWMEREIAQQDRQKPNSNGQIRLLNRIDLIISVSCPFGTQGLF
jgi:hypothetical protein